MDVSILQIYLNLSVLSNYEKNLHITRKMQQLLRLIEQCIVIIFTFDTYVTNHSIN